jgi:hypothetical protein
MPDLTNTFIVPFVASLVAFIMAMILWEMRTLMGRLRDLAWAVLRWIGRALGRQVRRWSLRLAWLILRGSPAPHREPPQARQPETTDPPPIYQHKDE